MQYIFGDYTLDTQQYTLHRGEILVPLRTKVFNVLSYLLAHHDRVVSRDELLEQIWPEQFVADGVLTACIKAARQAVGDTGRTQHIIKTVHGRGYRCIALVTTPTAPDGVLDTDDQDTDASSPTETAAPPTATTPSGYPPSQPPAQPSHDGERKLVTILSGNLVTVSDSSEPAELDEMHRLTQSAYALVLPEVERYGGTIQYVAGDSFLALFGAPVAQEDHAQRGVFAALSIQQQLDAQHAAQTLQPGVTLSFSMALHTGLVIIGPISHQQPQVVTVGGEVASVTAALAQRASPGAILVSDATRRLVPGEMEVTEQIQVEGQSTTVVAFQLSTVRSSHASLGNDEVRPFSQFVGREGELAMMTARLAQANKGQGQVVGLIGEPGIGKSRLLYELRQALQGQNVSYQQGRCQPYGHAIPFFPLRDLLHAMCGLSETDTEPTAVAKIHETLKHLELESYTCAPYLLLLLGYHMEDETLANLSPESVKERMFDALSQLLLHSSRQQPVVLVIEDLHWIDASSEAYLTALAERLVGMPILLLVTSRPGYHPEWMDKSYATQIALQPLGAEESRQVIHSILRGPQLNEATEQQLLAKADGNPFFLEEMAQALIEDHQNQSVVRIPNSIQAVLAARIDRLPSLDKDILQRAAVMGREVPLAILQAIADQPEEALQQTLRRLQTAEFFYEQNIAGARIYTFKHALTQEVAYDSLLKDRRRALHAQIVDILEAGAIDHPTEPVGVLAHHAVQGECWAQAVTYSRQAGLEALKRSSYQEATEQFECALAALQHLPGGREMDEQAIDLHFHLRGSLTPLREIERVLAHLREADRLAQRLQDDHRLGMVSSFMARCDFLMGNHDQAMQSARRARDLAVSLGEIDLQATGNLYCGQALYALGEYEQAMTPLTENLELLADERLYERFGQVNPPAVVSRTYLTWSLAELGRFSEGKTHGADALRIAEAIDYPHSLAIACLGVGVLALRQTDLPTASANLERAVALCRSARIQLLFPLAAASLGYVYALAGRPTEALPLIDQVRQISPLITPMATLAIALLGDAYALTGQLEDAHAFATLAMERSQASRERGIEAWALRLLGDITAQRHPVDADRAEAYYRQSLAQAENHGMQPLRALNLLSLGRLHQRLGKRQPAKAALAEATVCCQTLDMPFWRAQVDAATAL